MTDIPNFLKRVSDKTNFLRERYTEANITTSFSNLAVLCFFGDLRSHFILSSLLLHRYVKELWSSKYVILCSFPGFSSLYPYVNEFWTLRDENIVKKLWDNALGFSNDLTFYERELNKYFENVLPNTFATYYKEGLTQAFFDTFKWVQYQLPAVPSGKVELNRSLAQRAGYKVFIHPSRKLRSWHAGKEQIVDCPIDFWLALAQALYDHGFTPVVYQDLATYDLSPNLLTKGIYCTERSIMDAVGAMRTTGCVLDVFNGGVSRLALIARCPFITCAERRRYAILKEYELDDLCGGGNLPHEYIFSFATIIIGGHWQDLIDRVIMRLTKLMPSLNRDTWPATSEINKVVPYANVHKKKNKRIGSRFIKVKNE